MMLLIDIGNTNTVCALYDGENYTTTKRINLDDDPNQILTLFLNYNIINVAISSVVPTLTKIYIQNIFLRSVYRTILNNSTIEIKRMQVLNDRIQTFY